MTRFCRPASATHAAAAFREMRNVTFADDPELAWTGAAPWATAVS